MIGNWPAQSFVPPAPSSRSRVALNVRQATIAELKTSILRGVSKASRDPSFIPEVLARIRDIERQNPTPEPVDEAQALLNGTWSLVATYSVKGGKIAGGGAGARDGPLAALQALSDVVYETLYKNNKWSWLAGGMNSAGTEAARSFQNIDVTVKRF